jgi:hypothetical protein
LTNFQAFTGIPNRPNKPSVDQPNMTINNNSFIGIWAVDHVGFNQNDGGYHTTIHQVPVNSTPVSIQNRMQIYSKPVTPAYPGAPTSLELFTKNANSNNSTDRQESQLTGYIRNFNAASPFSNGWQWLGGVLVQWGFVPISSGVPASGTVTFTTFSQGIPFPNKVMNVQCNFTFTTGNIPQQGSSIFVDPATFTNTGFGWAVNTTSFGARITGFMWMAIGY